MSELDTMLNAAAASHARTLGSLREALANGSQYNAWETPPTAETRAAVQDAVNLSDLLRETIQHARRLSLLKSPTAA